MKVQFELAIGENKFTLIEDVETHTDFFKKLNFYSTLPKTGPNGETDLVLRHRVATTRAGKKVDYYSIVSEKAGKEFKFGQSQQIQGALFPKGWEPLYGANGDESDESEEAQASAPTAGLGGLGAASAPAAPAAQPAVSLTGLGAPPKPAAAPAPAPAATTTAAPAANPTVKKNANEILSKFGL